MTQDSQLKTPFLPYSRQSINRDDIAAVVEVLQSDFLTTGPMVQRFEKAVAEYTGAGHAVAVNSGTAALHCMMNAIGIAAGDEVIVPALTFAATANCVVYQGGTPVIVDVDPGTLLICPDAVQAAITPRTRAIVAVDYAGQPCDYQRLEEIARRHNLVLLSDACHSLSGSYKGRRVGVLSSMTAFSFHPVKPITTGEGGMITTDDPQLAEQMRCFRSHGISADHKARTSEGTWFYEMQQLGYNYRASDLQCALGLSQLTRLDEFAQQRRAISAKYRELLDGFPGIECLQLRPDIEHAYHLFVVRCNEAELNGDRRQLFQFLRSANVGVNVHYVPVHLHPYYKQTHGTREGMCPVAESAYQQILSLPVHPGMCSDDVHRVVNLIADFAAGAR